MQTTKVVKPHRSQRAWVNSNRGKTSKRLALKCMAYDQRFGTVNYTLDEGFATECGVGEYMDVTVPLADFYRKSAQELEGEHGGRGMAFATPDQE